jgi:hypothetical protein
MSEVKNGWHVVNGYKIHYKDGKKHNEDGPAWIGVSFRGYYKEGKEHREDGPAWIWNDGTCSYYLEGLPVKPRPKSDLEWALTVKKWKEEQREELTKEYLE